jgi:WD40 repeat protein
MIDAVSGNETRSVPTDGVEPEWVAVDPTGSRVLVSNFETGVVKIFDFATYDSIDIDSISRQTLGWNHDGSSVAVSGNGAVVEVFNSVTGMLDMSLSTHKSSLFALLFSADGESLFSVSLDGEAVQWSVTGDGPNDNGALLADGDLLRAEPSGAKGFLVQFDHAKIFDLRSGEVLFRADVDFGVPDQAVTNESFSFVGGFDPESNRHVVWETATKDIVATYDECTVPKAISPDGELIVLTIPVDRPECEQPSESRIENLATGQVLLPLPDVRINTAEFSPADTFDGELYLAINRNTHHDMVEVYSVTKREIVARFDDTTFPNLADVTFLTPMFSSDGRFLGLGMNAGLVAAASMEELVVGESPGESLLINHIGHDGNAPRPSISSSGVMATTGFDQWVRLWDLSSQNKLVEFQTGSDFRSPFVAFSGDEEMLLYSDVNGLIRSYPLDVEVLLSRANTLLTRTLTDDECTQYLHTDGCED